MQAPTLQCPFPQVHTWYPGEHPLELFHFRVWSFRHSNSLAALQVATVSPRPWSYDLSHSGPCLPSSFADTCTTMQWGQDLAAHSTHDDRPPDFHPQHFFSRGGVWALSPRLPQAHFLQANDRDDLHLMLWPHYHH